MSYYRICWMCREAMVVRYATDENLCYECKNKEEITGRKISEND